MVTRRLSHGDVIAKRIADLLKKLGYSEQRPGEIEHDKPIQIGSVPVAADIVLNINDVPAVVIEVKRPQEKLDALKFKRQAISYGCVLRTRYSVLTNGDTLRVYDTVTEELVQDTSVEKPPSFLAKEMLATNIRRRAIRIAEEKVEEAKNVIENEGAAIAILHSLNRVSPIDKAHIFNTLLTKYTTRQLGNMIGCSAAAISQTRILLRLTPELQTEVAEGSLSETQGTVIAQAVGKYALPLQKTLMDEIKKKIDEFREIRSKLDTPDVKAIAKRAVTYLTAPTMRSQQKMMPGLASANAGEKHDVEKFLRTMEGIRKSLVPFVKYADSNVRRRFAEALTESRKDVASYVQDSVVFLEKLCRTLNAVAKERQLER